MSVALLVDRVVVGNGAVLGRSTVVVGEDGRIARVLSGHGTVAAAKAVRFGPDSTLMPGFIDTHVHLSIFSGDYQLDLLRVSPEDRALGSLAAAQGLLRAGFTTVRSAGDADAMGFPSLAVGRAVERGLFEGPRVVGAGHYISVTSGGGDVSAFPGRAIAADGLVADGPEAMRVAVRRELRGGADWIKVLATGAFMASAAGDSPEHTHVTDAELHAIVDEATRRGVPVMAHAHGARGIELCARAGVRSIEHASFIDDAGIDACLANGVYIVPTLQVGDFDFSSSAMQERSVRLLHQTKERHIACMRRAAQRGVKMALGSDYCGWKPSLSAREFAHLAAVGLSPAEAIRAGTLGAAEMLRLERDIGSVEVGKCADLVVVDGNPLADLSVLETGVTTVFRNGRQVTMQTARL
jgi:imidazolonepropionase-like amidohydrolase